MILEIAGKLMQLLMLKDFCKKKLKIFFNVKLSYSVDLVTPESDSLISIYNDIIEEINDEELIDIPLEAQIEIDSTFSEGNIFIGF